MTYSDYLFVCLLKEYDEDFASRPIQEQYDLSKSLYMEFTKSKFYDKNDVSKELDTCIIEYLENKYNSAYLDIDEEEEE